jgi:hypothetical protein
LVNTLDDGSGQARDHKAKFEMEAAGLIASLETTAVDQAHGRVYEESYDVWYRRGADRDAQPFASKEEAALAYEAKGR